MASTNFKLFDENKVNMMSDTEYNIASQRLNGVQTGIASSQLQNKTLYQTSLMSYALAQLMNANGIDANDTSAVSAFVNGLSDSIVQKVLDKATQEMAIEGTDNSHYMTPLSVKKGFGSGRKILFEQDISSAGTYNFEITDEMFNNYSDIQVVFMNDRKNYSYINISDIYLDVVSEGSASYSQSDVHGYNIFNGVLTAVNETTYDPIKISSNSNVPILIYRTLSYFYISTKFFNQNSHNEMVRSISKQRDTQLYNKLKIKIETLGGNYPDRIIVSGIKLF